MLVKEMHIGIDLLLKYENSNRTKGLLPEEKDNALYKATLQFINSRISSKSNPKAEGFEDTQKRIEDLEELKRTVLLQTYIDSIEPKGEYVVQPIDYYSLIKSRSKLKYNCVGFDIDGKVQGTKEIISTATVNEYVCIVPWITDTNNINTPYYEQFKISETEDFPTTAVNVTTNTITASNGMYSRGQAVYFTSSNTIPVPLVAYTVYYVSAGTASIFTLAPTYADAMAGTNTVDITTQGVGTHTIYSIIFDISNMNGTGTPVIPLVLGSLNQEESRFILITELLYYINMRTYNMSIKVYWERYRDTYYPNSFIFVSDKSYLRITFNFKYDPTTWINEVIAPTIKTYTYLNFTGTVIKPNRIVSTEVVHDLNDHIFGKTVWISPLTTENHGLLKVFYDDYFLVDKIYMDYIKNPNPICLALGQNCEINPKFHQEIVNIAVQNLKAIINDPNYKEVINENRIME
jgi:hypothetical protein